MEYRDSESHSISLSFGKYDPVFHQSIASAKVTVSHVEDFSFASLTAASSALSLPKVELPQRASPPLFEHPSLVQFLKHPIALMAYVPKSTAMFFAGALSGAVAKTTTAPLDRIKLQMQVTKNFREMQSCSVS